MKVIQPTRRGFLVAASGFMTALLLPSNSHGQGIIKAYRNPGCGCCEQWSEILKAAGFDVAMEDDADLAGRRKAAGVPDDLAGCHLAMMGDYIIDGHVPLREIERLLTEKPAIHGIAVPGMPVGSPGMEMGNSREAYDVIAFKSDGTRTVYASY